MSWKNTPDRFGSLSIGLHWLMVLQLIAVYTCINLSNFYPENSPPARAWEHWHFMMGLSVLAVVLVRIAARLTGVVPATLPGTPAWQRRIAGLTHLALYALLLCMPILGWLTLSSAGMAIPFFGLELPALLAKDRNLEHSLEAIHRTLGTIGYYLIGLHTLAALYHHYVLKDAVLKRMLPAAGK